MSLDPDPFRRLSIGSLNDLENMQESNNQDENPGLKGLIKSSGKFLSKHYEPATELRQSGNYIDAGLKGALLTGQGALKALAMPFKGIGFGINYLSIALIGLTFRPLSALAKKLESQNDIKNIAKLEIALINFAKFITAGPFSAIGAGLDCLANGDLKTWNKSFAKTSRSVDEAVKKLENTACKAEIKQHIQELIPVLNEKKEGGSDKLHTIKASIILALKENILNDDDVSELNKFISQRALKVFSRLDKDKISDLLDFSSFAPIDSSEELTSSQDSFPLRKLNHPYKTPTSTVSDEFQKPPIEKKDKSIKTLSKKNATNAFNEALKMDDFKEALKALERCNKFNQKDYGKFLESVNNHIFGRREEGAYSKSRKLHEYLTEHAEG